MENDFDYNIILKNIKQISNSLQCKQTVFPMQIFTNLISTILQNSSEEYTLTYGDFNNLGKFNGRYGKEAGTQAIVDSITLIQEYLPENTITIRVAGDEFIFISPGAQRSDIQQCTTSINHDLQSDPSKFLSMTFGVVDSHEAKSIFDIYTLAEQRSSKAKLAQKSSEYTNTTLQEKLDDNFSRFFNNYRFSDKIIITNEYLKQIGELAIKSSLDLINSTEYRNRLSNSKNVSSDFVPSHTTSMFSKTQATILFDYISGTDIENIDRISKQIEGSQISDLLKSLIQNPNTNLHNSIYYDSFFKNEITNRRFIPQTAIAIELTNIKDSNTKTSHLETDRKISEFSQEIQKKLFDVCGIVLDNNRFSFDQEHNYIFNRGAGDFLILLGYHSVSDAKILRFLNEIGEFNVKPMNIISSYCDIKSSYNDSLAGIYKDLAVKKNSLLVNSLSSLEFKEALDLFILDSVEFFIKNCPDSSDINNIRGFLHQLTTSLTNQGIKCNQDYRMKRE